MFFLEEGVFKQYQRAGERVGESGGVRVGPQPDKMATHSHRHYRHHRHSIRSKIGAPYQDSNHPRRGMGVEGGRRQEKRRRGVGWPHRLIGSVLQ